MTHNDTTGPTIEHEDWTDVTDKTGFEYHWHAKDPGDEEYISIRMEDETGDFSSSLGGYTDGWTVEMSPHPDDDSLGVERWRFPPDEYENPERAAREHVLELMEEHG